MYTLLEWYISAPAWLRGAVTGGAFGCTGGGLAYFFANYPKVQRGIVVAFIVFGLAVAPKILEPIALTAYANKDLPKQVDEFTILRHIDFERRATIYRYEISDALGETFDASAIKLANGPSLCSTWESSFAKDRGFEARYNYLFRETWSGFIVSATDCD